jgi:hypothetical protein
MAERKENERRNEGWNTGWDATLNVSRDDSRNARNCGSRYGSNNAADNGCRSVHEDEGNYRSHDQCRDESENRSLNAGCNTWNDASCDHSLAASDDACQNVGRSGSRNVRED